MLDANIIYYRLIEINEDKFFSNREKLILYFDVVKELFNSIIENDQISYTEYALFHYILKRFEVPLDLKTNVINLRRYISKFKSHPKLYPTNSFINKVFTNIIRLVFHITAEEIPSKIADMINKDFLYTEMVVQKTYRENVEGYTDVIENTNEKNKKITAIISYKLSADTMIICQNDDGKYIILVNEKLSHLLSMSKKLSVVCFTALEKCEPIVSNLEEENELFSGALFYKTTNKTQIILEPNFLVDVTELTDCFQFKSSNPIISILKRLYPNNILSASAFEGNIINHFFDELLENIEVDFNTCIENALIKNPLALMYVAYKDNLDSISNTDVLEEKHYSYADDKMSYKYDNNKNIQKYLKNNRSKWFDKYSKLRDIIAKNFLETTNIIEPSFISSVYGLQGRLDLMIENINGDNTKFIDIVELKSSKAPSKICNVGIGLFNKRKYSIPLWVSHYIQIMCYNMLLEHIFDSNNIIKGNSTILYAEPTESNPLRSVVEDNIYVQSEILFFRNYIVMFLKEIADGNISFIENIDTKQIEESFPKYAIEQTRTLIYKLKALSPLEKAYFNLQLSFIAKEMFAQKIGLYSDATHKNSNGFSALWLNSIEEKQLTGNIIIGLKLDIENSDFNNMYITFHRNSILPFWHPNLSYSSKQEVSDITEEMTFFAEMTDKEVKMTKAEKINIPNDRVLEQRTSFRTGDICIVYPIKYENYVPINEQVFRGRILEINDNYIKVSFRNKLSTKMFQNDYYWALETDYMEKGNTILFNSISNFMFNDFPNKNCILGIQEPTFEIKEQINQAVNNILELDDDKKNIIMNALSTKNYYLIQGPPGTGKTSYMLRYLTQLLFIHTQENILLLAYTNRAVDEICSSILKIKEVFPYFDFIRFGNKDSSKHTDHILSNIKISDIEYRVSNCRIFVSTIQTANSNPELFTIKNINTIIVDEAAQILESHIIGLLSKVSRFIMIGDEKQLPPITILSKQHLKTNSELLNSVGIKNLNESLFERLLKYCKQKNINAYSLLSKQCRMSKQIMSIVNTLFYDEKLQCGNINRIENADNLYKNINFLDSDKDCFFINTPTSNSNSNSNKINDYEINVILKLINIIKQHNTKITADSIGIISPWRMQCSAIINKLDSRDKELITVDTVERFQGAERDIIIFSAAINSTYFLNILSHIVDIDNTLVDRKLNVAITRAKKKFILLGNYDILAQNIMYKKLISFLEWIDIKTI